MTDCFSSLSGWPDSNWRPLRPERSALPTALHPECFSRGKAVQNYTFFLKREHFCKEKWRKICEFHFLVLTLHRLKEKRWCLSSVGRASDWKSVCPRFDSWRYHFLLSLWTPWMTSVRNGVFQLIHRKLENKFDSILDSLRMEIIVELVTCTE